MSIEIYFKNVMRQSSGNIIAQIISLLSLPLITRIFDPGAFAEYRIFIELMPICAIVCSFKFEHCIMLESSDIRARILAHFVVLYSFFALLLLYLMVLPFIYFTITSMRFELLWVLPLAGFLTVTSQAFLFLDQRREDFTKSGIVEVLNKTFNNAFVILFSLFSKSSIILALGMCLGLLIKLSYLRPNPKKIIRSITRIRILFMKILYEGDYLKRICFLNLSDVLLSIVRIAPILFISAIYGEDSAGQFGLITAALVFPTVILGRAVGQVFYQKAASSFNSKTQITRLFIYNLVVLGFIGLFGYSLIFLFGKEIFTLIFGERWELAGELAQVYSIAGWMSFVSIPFERTALVVNAWWYPPLWYVGRLLTTLIVLLYAFLNQIDFPSFVFFLTMQVAILHLIDVLCSYLFCRYRWVV